MLLKELLLEIADEVRSFPFLSVPGASALISSDCSYTETSRQSSMIRYSPPRIRRT